LPLLYFASKKDWESLFDVMAKIPIQMAVGYLAWHVFNSLFALVVHTYVFLCFIPTIGVEPGEGVTVW
jgi:hypothetical protein